MPSTTELSARPSDISRNTGQRKSCVCRISNRMLDWRSEFQGAFRMSPVLVVHGGAWAMPDDMVEAHKTGVRNAIGAGWAVLQRGGIALDAVEDAIVILEDAETFDAGRVRFLNREGKRQMTALRL